MFEFEMLPIFSMNEQANCGISKSILTCKFKCTRFTIVEILKYLKCLLFSNLCHSRLFAYGSTFLSVAILLVLFCSSKNQVIRIDTPRVITFVQNVELAGVSLVHCVGYPAQFHKKDLQYTGLLCNLGILRKEINSNDREQSNQGEQPAKTASCIV